MSEYEGKYDRRLLERCRELEGLRDRAHDALQDLLDYIYMIAPEASSEEIDEAKRVLRMLDND